MYLPATVAILYGLAGLLSGSTDPDDGLPGFPVSVIFIVMGLLALWFQLREDRRDN
jgi:hypothetical protein